MRYDRDMEIRRRDRPRGDWVGRGEYGEAYEAPDEGRFHGYSMGYGGGALRSRGSFQADQLRSGLNPVDEFEFEWGDGYVGGRGYGGTNYDLQHGYRIGGTPRYTQSEEPPSPRAFSSPAARGGYSWSEYETGEQLYGPARYGYGPYHERLARKRRSDDEIRENVEEALFYDTWVDADQIQVQVEEGIVTLSGTLPSYDEVRYATDDTWDIDGVRGVRSELKVRERRERYGGRPADEDAANEEERGKGTRREPGAEPREGTEPKGRTRGRRQASAKDEKSAKRSESGASGSRGSRARKAGAGKASEKKE